MIDTVTIERIAAGGDGVGHLHDGLTVFVPRTAPGDKVKVEVVRRKARYAWGRLVGLESSGPDRTEPACVHYNRDDCGGCQLQHLSPESQRQVKRRLVGDALRRIGKRDVADPEIVASRKEWRYRTKITLAAKGERIGFHPYDRPDSAFDLGDCLLAHEKVTTLWALVKAKRTLLPVEFEHLILRMDRLQKLHVVVVGGEKVWNAKALAGALDYPDITFWWKPNLGATRVVLGQRSGFPAVAFEQVNSEVADGIRHNAAEGLGDVEGKVVWDLYAGVGDTAELLAKRGARVWSVEKDRSAVEWGRNWYGGEDREGTPVTRVADRIEDCLTRLREPDMVLVNPPRSGLHPRLASWLETWGRRGCASRIAYISCDPATLARDLERLPSFELFGLTAYDLFPQTGHVETLALLEAK